MEFSTGSWESISAKVRLGWFGDALLNFVKAMMIDQVRKKLDPGPDYCWTLRPNERECVILYLM